MTRVALLGTGLLGSGFAEGLLTRGGVELTVWNRTRAKAERLAPHGARVAETIADAVAGAERVHMILKDDESVEAAIDSMRPALGTDTMLCDHTTNLPRRTAERAVRLTSEGVKYLHCPVFMSPAAARAAQGIMMVSGALALFERVQRALEPMTGDLWYLGERPDLAACFKLFGNAMLLTLGGGLADVFHMADALRVDREQAWTLFTRFNITGTLPIRAKKILTEDYAPSFELTMARKDAGLMLESGGADPLPVLRAIAGRMDELIAQGFGDRDMSVMARRA